MFTVDDSSLKLFCSRVHFKDADNHLSHLTSHRKINSFHLTPTHTTGITYRNQANGETFSINVQHVNVEYSLEVKRSMSCWYDGKYSKSRTSLTGQEDYTSTASGAQVCGITVADLFKLYYKKHRDEFGRGHLTSTSTSSKNASILPKAAASGNDDDDDSHTPSATTIDASAVDDCQREAKRELEQVEAHIKKGATRMDTSRSGRDTANIKHMIGLYSNGVVEPWYEVVDELSGPSVTRKSFAAFCSSYVYFPAMRFAGHNKRSGHGYRSGRHHYSSSNDGNKHTLSEKNCIDFLNEPIPHRMVALLARHFIFGAPLPCSGYTGGRTTGRNTRASGEITMFDSPKKLTDHLLFLATTEVSEATGHGNGENRYLKLYKKITGHINRREQKELEEKYGEWTVDNIGKIPDTYPIWALRSVYIKSWRSNDDDNLLHYDDFSRAVHNPKYKHRRDTAARECDIDTDPLNWFLSKSSGCYCSRCVPSQPDQKTVSSGLKMDGFSPLTSSSSVSSAEYLVGCSNFTSGSDSRHGDASTSYTDGGDGGDGDDGDDAGDDAGDGDDGDDVDTSSTSRHTLFDYMPRSLFQDDQEKKVEEAKKEDVETVDSQKTMDDAKTDDSSEWQMVN